MVTAVWGDWHIRQLLELNLPTLVAESNLPTFARRHHVSYCIFSRAGDIEKLTAAPIIGHLRTLMPVDFKILPDGILTNPIAAHHHAWDDATRTARAGDAFILYLPPDVAWSDRSFSHLADLLAEGRQAIFMTYLRAESDSFTAAIQARPRAGFALPISGRELVALALECLHPLMAASLKTSSRLPRHPEMLFWAVPGEGLSLRVLAREMFLFNPRRFDLNAAKLIGNQIAQHEIHFVSDSDELFAVSLAELGKDVDWHMRRCTADPVEIGRWWLNYDSPANDTLARHKIRWHFAPVSESKWRRRELAGDLFLRRCGIVREGLRIRTVAQEQGCSRAAQLIAYAAYRGILGRAVRGDGAATIFLPVNAAFERLPPRQLDRMLTPAGAGELTRFLRAHCLVSAQRGAPTVLRGSTPAVRRKAANWLCGTSAERHSPSVAEAQAIGRPLPVGRHTVILLDRCLAPVL